MQAVVETPDYLADAREAGLSDAERQAIVDYLADHPTAGDLIPGTGGARKLRLAGQSKGKSGGYRVITYFGGDDIPVFLLAVFAPMLVRGRQGESQPSRTQRLARRVGRIGQGLSGGSPSPRPPDQVRAS